MLHHPHSLYSPAINQKSQAFSLPEPQLQTKDLEISIHQHLETLESAIFERGWWNLQERVQQNPWNLCQSRAGRWNRSCPGKRFYRISLCQIKHTSGWACVSAFLIREDIRPSLRKWGFSVSEQTAKRRRAGINRILFRTEMGKTSLGWEFWQPWKKAHQSVAWVVGPAIWA